MEIISKHEAITRGLSKYFTGEPCRNGHIAERYVNGGACQLCVNPAVRRPADPERLELAKKKLEIAEEKLRLRTEELKLKQQRQADRSAQHQQSSEYKGQLAADRVQRQQLAASREQRLQADRVQRQATKTVKSRITHFNNLLWGPHVPAVHDLCYVMAAAREPSVTFADVAPRGGGGLVGTYKVFGFPEDIPFLLEFCIDLFKGSPVSATSADVAASRVKREATLAAARNAEIEANWPQGDPR